MVFPTLVLVVSITLTVNMASAQTGRMPWCQTQPDYSNPMMAYSYSPACSTDKQTAVCECRSPLSLCAYKTATDPYGSCINATTKTASLYKVIKNFTATTLKDCCDRTISASMIAKTSNGVPLVSGLNKLPNGTTISLTCKPGYFMADAISGQLCTDNCQQFKSPMTSPYCTLDKSLSDTLWQFSWNDTTTGTGNIVVCLPFHNLNEQCGGWLVDYYMPDTPTGKSMCQTNLSCSGGKCVLQLGGKCSASAPCTPDALCLKGVCSDGSTLTKYNATMTAKCGYSSGTKPAWINVTSTTKFASQIPPQCKPPSEITTTSTSTTTTTKTTTTTTGKPTTPELPDCGTNTLKEKPCAKKSSSNEFKAESSIPLCICSDLTYETCGITNDFYWHKDAYCTNARTYQNFMDRKYFSFPGDGTWKKLF